MTVSFGTTTLTAGPDTITDQAGPLRVSARLNFDGATAGDTFIIRCDITMVEGPTVVTDFYRELVYGTTVLDDGVFGVDLKAYTTRVFWWELNGAITVEQTVGTPIDLVWEVATL